MRLCICDLQCQHHAFPFIGHAQLGVAQFSIRHRFQNLVCRLEINHQVELARALLRIIRETIGIRGDLVAVISIRCGTGKFLQISVVVDVILIP